MYLKETRFEGVDWIYLAQDGIQWQVVVKTIMDHLVSYSLFVVFHLTTLFQYLRLYSVDFYSILIRLPSSSKAGETRVRNMAAEFFRRAPIVLGFLNMP
jgi:hypothetical protein